MRTIFFLIGIAGILSFACNPSKSDNQIKGIALIKHTQQDAKYAISAFRKACRERGIDVQEFDQEVDGWLNLILKDSADQKGNHALVDESYELHGIDQDKMMVFTSDKRGLIYALQSAFEALFIFNKNISEIHVRNEPEFGFRSIKFNLPWNSYREHETLQLHAATLRDLGFWERFLDMMSENRFNTLTLWSVHPWTYMIRPEKYPEACPFNDEELADWQNYWHGLFALANERGIKVFMINWNIFVSPEFSKLKDVAEYSQHLDWGYNGDGDYSELVQQYNKDLVREVLETYPELSGIGVSQNERMKGENISEEKWQQWIVDTYFDIVKEARPSGEFILRGHTHPAPELTRSAIENNADRLPEKVWVPLKYNWSHGHARPQLFYIHGGSDSDIWWNPVPDRYKVVFTIRNEDFFVLRWGSYSFIEELLKFNRSNPAVGGFIIGSETYIPAKDYITLPGDHKTWDYAFEKQWLFYKLWGRLMYNSDLSKEVFNDAFNHQYGIKQGHLLLEAFDLASQMPLKLASYYGATWDFTLYSEGFLSGFRPWRGEKWDSHSAFLSVEDIVGANPVDENWQNIEEYVQTITSAKALSDSMTTPLEIADELHRSGTGALKILESLNPGQPTLNHEMADIKTWAYLSLYFSEKLKGCVAFEYFRKEGDLEQKEIAVNHLNNALNYWDKVIETSASYFDEMPLLHFGDNFIEEDFVRPVEMFSWKNFRDQVVRDIEYVREY